jgi:NagD protein
MDGVIYHGNHLLPGVHEFLNEIERLGIEFLFLTNSSERSPKELQQKLARLGIDMEEHHFYTSALATADFLSKQLPGCSAYVIGEAGLTNALYDMGISMNDMNPDYVVVGDTRSYNFEKLEKALRLVMSGAKLIGTNYDLTGPVESGLVPSTRALLSPIELATGKQAYYVGKPNPLMMRTALAKLGCSSEQTAIVGDRMDTDIIAGIESEIETILVLSGVTTHESMSEFPYRPGYVAEGVGQIAEIMREIETSGALY